MPAPQEMLTTALLEQTKALVILAEGQRRTNELLEEIADAVCGAADEDGATNGTASDDPIAQLGELKDKLEGLASLKRKRADNAEKET
ncbi:MAG TPA: hypothetical protein VEA38_11670 [Terriglobales bacterium]|nr:hypothetical protein [Terriglobales bacterium]